MQQALGQERAHRVHRLRSNAQHWRELPLDLKARGLTITMVEVAATLGLFATLARAPLPPAASRIRWSTSGGRD